MIEQATAGVTNLIDIQTALQSNLSVELNNLMESINDTAARVMEILTETTISSSIISNQYTETSTRTAETSKNSGNLSFYASSIFVFSGYYCCYDVKLSEMTHTKIKSDFHVFQNHFSQWFRIWLHDRK